MLQQKLSQKLLQKLSPQQIQLMKLLQVSTAQFEQRIKEELETNPALEEGDADLKENDPLDAEEPDDDFNEAEIDAYLENYAEDDPAIYANNRSADDDEKHRPTIAVTRTFHDYLFDQLHLLRLKTERGKTIARQLIGSIDDDGYLRRDTEAIMDDLLFSQNMEVSEEEIKSVLKRVQEFDPPGVGARDLQECLILQLEAKLKQTEEDSDLYNIRLLAIEVLSKYFKNFSRKNYEKLMAQLNIEEEMMKTILAEIVKLNPKPASNIISSTTTDNHYIIPDFIAENRDGEINIVLNRRNSPDIQVNHQYVKMLTDIRNRSKNKKTPSSDRQTIKFIKQKLDTAKWFVDAIEQRKATLHSVMYAILQLQYDYFKYGDPLMIKPMILKDVSDITGLDISTVSRVVNNKYVQTEFGTKRLKFFFSESSQMLDGTEISTLEVKNSLLEFIQDENKKHPFSDEQLRELLVNKGYDIARRTVSKYREVLNIPTAKMRRELV